MSYIVVTGDDVQFGNMNFILILIILIFSKRKNYICYILIYNNEYQVQSTNVIQNFQIVAI